MSRPVVFIDRDGTINEEAGYMNHIDSFKIFDFVPQAIRLLNINNILAIVLTNQGGIARGYFSEELVLNIHKKMLEDLSQRGALIDRLYYCPHYPKGSHPLYGIDCDCRKPKDGMFKKALKDFDIDIKKMFVVGDKFTDIELGENIGAYKILVRTGYGKGEELEIGKRSIKPDEVCDNLLMAVLSILKKV
ncbi:MAG: HAD family hydrolase [Calditerrivibrio sp.]|nr:HAD family hydrolase [Calditerrivibrio sp.]MCA1932689.1 HAD family hydrolase [Calditerrivibrio sp.]MCA1980760.1 HAD family hydrolase [Calditerrivibrio sp.]